MCGSHPPSSNPPRFGPIKTKGSPNYTTTYPFLATNKKDYRKNLQQRKPIRTLLHNQVTSFFWFPMATSVSATGFQGGLCSSSIHGSWGTSMLGEDHAALARSARANVRVGKPVRMMPVMKNVNEGKGIFAPLVVITRNIIGKKTFNQLRGKAIALHSQVNESSFSPPTTKPKPPAPQPEVYS